jgi:hypothetical protein
MSEGLLDVERMRTAVLAARDQLATGRPRYHTQRVKARVVSNVRLEAQVGEFRLISDEHPERGGEGAGPSPLQYFLAGTGF